MCLVVLAVFAVITVLLTLQVKYRINSTRLIVWKPVFG